MKRLNIFLYIFSFVCLCGCTTHEQTIYEIIDENIQAIKPTLLFVSNPSLGNYKHLKNILKDEEVRKVLRNFHFVEKKTSETNEIHQLLYTHRSNFFLILDADSIMRVIPSPYSSKKFISALNDYTGKTLAATLKEISLLSYKDSVVATNTLNRILRSNYYAFKGNISKSDYIDNIRKSTEDMPYFYNRYLLATATENYDKLEWADSLKTNERNIYDDCIKDLKRKMFHIHPESHSNIRFKSKEINLGNIPLNEEVSCLFTFTNESDVPAIIYHVKPTCGCTVAEWVKSPIQRKDSSHIKIMFKGENKGFFRKTIKVFTNSKHPETTLTLSGTIIF